MWVGQHFSLPRFTRSYKGDSKHWQKVAEWETAEQEQETFLYLTNLCLNMFEWEGLPETCNERKLEEVLFFYGKALFFRDDAVNDKGKFPTVDIKGKPFYWHTPATLGNGLNIYGDHTQRWGYSYGFNKKFDMNNSVLIRNIATMTPTYHTVQVFTSKLVQIARSIDLCVRNLRSAYLIVGGQEDKMQLNALMEEIYSGKPAVFTTPGIADVERIKVWPTATQPATLVELWNSYHETMDAFLTRMGINNANKTKKERLVVDEANANNQMVDESGDVYLRARERACDECNKLFEGLSISVKRRESPVRQEGEGGDGGLHSDDRGASA